MGWDPQPEEASDLERLDMQTGQGKIGIGLHVAAVHDCLVADPCERGASSTGASVRTSRCLGRHPANQGGVYCGPRE